MAVTVEGFILCDSAQDYAGRVSILGAFVNIIQAQSLPTIHQLGLVTRLTWPRTEIGEGHTLAAEVRHDADDELIARLDFQLPPLNPPTEHEALPASVNLVAPLVLHLRRPGVYSTRLIVDGGEITEVRRTLEVITILPVP